MAKGTADDRMQRSLALRHVFALSTGAMVSSGLFLLPGLAVEKGGPSAILAYGIAGLLVVPAMLSVSELATAMPRAGGAYYFLERAMGPAVGTIAGAGTWLSLVLKDAFAAVGMSAYLNIVVDVPAKPLALALIAVFTVLNLVGSKTSASVQLVMIGFVLVVMAVFLGGGLTDVSGGEGSLEPFFEDGLTGLIAVIGLVFVSYGGLNTVASVAEEIDDPSRTIPLGMALSLMASTTLYTLAVLVTVAVVPAEILHDDLAPIHSAAEAVLPSAGAILVIIAALAAFSSAVNSGILSAGRYPLAMSRDGLLPPVFQKLTAGKAPLTGVLVTGAAMALVVLAFDVTAIAKLASAFVLLTLGLVNLAVIVLRASHIQSYAPEFRAPLYPWLQLAGISIAVFLILELGALPLALVGAVIAVCIGWYLTYGRSRATRAGAIYHVFERWGQGADRSLDREISAAMQSHSLRPQDEYPGLIARASVISIPAGLDFGEAAERAAAVLGQRLEIDSAIVANEFQQSGSLWIQPSEQYPTATPVAFFDHVEDEHLVIVRAPSGVRIPAQWGGSGETVKALFFLAGLAEDAGRALGLAAELAAYRHSDTGDSMTEASSESEVKAGLLPELQIEQYTLMAELPAGKLIGDRVGALLPPKGVILEAVRRSGRVLRATSDVVLEADDQLTIIGPIGHLPAADALADQLLGM